MADYQSFVSAVEKVKRIFAIESLEQEQLEALYNFVCRRDVFVNLPTGFGKSLVYQMVPFVVKELNICENPIVLIVSPLVTLMQDQVTQLSKQGISAISLSKDVQNDNKLKSGCYTMVYSSPESLLNNEQIREIIGSHVYQQRVFGIVVDEAHCISHW
jgi:superfamily II DNA helicase RecQ